VPESGVPCPSAIGKMPLGSHRNLNRNWRLTPHA
jgi:hypothetical protein